MWADEYVPVRFGGAALSSTGDFEAPFLIVPSFGELTMVASACGGGDEVCVDGRPWLTDMTMLWISGEGSPF